MKLNHAELAIRQLENQTLLSTDWIDSPIMHADAAGLQ